jgi:epoxyqueuosine reductase
METYRKDIHTQIIERAKELGASLAGIASVETLKKSPSHSIYGKIDYFDSVGNKEGHVEPCTVAWPEKSRSAIIIAVEHPEENPEMDWWQAGYKGGTPGNRMLISINNKLSEWLETERGIQTNPLSYHVEKGGIFLKDTAVMAGLGCIGKNNMLVTPEYGPRVRLRVMLTEEVLPASGPVDFDPCEGCPMPCRDVCPQGAFQKKIYSEKELGFNKLPARSGIYSRYRCNKQMVLDEEAYEEIELEGRHQLGKLVKYCRQCEWACPVGKAG